MLQTLQRTAEVAGEIEMTKSHLNKTSEDLQQWVTDVQLWAASTPSTISSHDPQGLQRLMEGLVPKIHQKKMELYRETDNNKDRRRKRSAIAKEKSKLEEAITSYNALVSNAEVVDPADALLAQDFSIWPWETVHHHPPQNHRLTPATQDILLAKLEVARASLHLRLEATSYLRSSALYASLKPTGHLTGDLHLLAKYQNRVRLEGAGSSLRKP
ncbi:uncharacterized protein LOC132152562 [Carassius carassius]|uniref:uncharacterized protein LOC132152562 n=1 Tax=Carassius carassius TaxID=217509 RepID=UPI0028693348|nr:uncharacterized protein LOC132152562 [Carassius carassius]